MPAIGGGKTIKLWERLQPRMKLASNFAAEAAPTLG